MGETILKMTNISKRFGGVAALSDVSMELSKGEVRALIGENGAGKSTLMKILLGIHQADAGEIEFDGHQVHFKEPKQALDAGISMIHQEISLIPTVDVAENIWMGREDKFTKMGWWIDQSRRYAATKELLDTLGIQVNPRTTVSLLSIAMMQLVELARAVSYDSKIIIMDEPTSALSAEEVELLFSIVRKLTNQGVTILFISHKIDEIFAICDSATVLRDGQYIGTHTLNEKIDNDSLIAMIVGRELSDIYNKVEIKPGKTVLEVKNLYSQSVFKDVSFSVRAGEIVGFSGLMGAGRSEIARALFGIDRYTSGEILIDGKSVRITSPEQAIQNGLAMVTEDRLRQGTIYKLSVMHNATLANLFRMVRLGFIDRKRENNAFAELSSQLSIKYGRKSDSINTLSGGNQQKVILGRWLLTNPKVLILDEPTRGIDIGSKSEIYKLINRLAAQGLAIIFISSELPEILGLCDKTYVVRNGKLVFECPRAEMTQELLAQHAFGL